MILNIKINGIVYKYTNKGNGRVYIGQTTREHERILEHKRHNEKTEFHSDVEKYGYDNFEYEVLYRVTGWDNRLISIVLNAIEAYYIGVFDATNPNKGYNKDKGGRCGRRYW